MTEETGQPRPSELSRLDRVVALLIVGLAMLALFLVWRGTHFAVSVSSLTPEQNRQDTPVTSNIQVEFSEAMAIDLLPQIELRPATAGDLRWQDSRTLIFIPRTPLAPNTDYTVEITGNLQSANGRTVTMPLSWEFHTREARIAFLSWDEQDYVQIYVTSLQSNTIEPLTQAGQGVNDFAVSPDGDRIAYAAHREGGASDIWIMDSNGDNARRVLECPGYLCSNAVWSGDGLHLVYERRRLFSDDEPGPPRLWWLDPASGDTTPVFADEQWLGLGARFSADGRWLSYVVPLEEMARIYNFETGESITIPNRIGEPAVWHPYENVLLSTDIEYQGERFAVHVYRVDLATGEMIRASDQARTNDSSPSWSPDGEWIAFGRKLPRAPVGRQIWIMNAEEGQSRQLTSNPEINFGPPRWSPDGRYLLTQRYNMSEPDAEPGVWLLEVETGQLREVASPGYQPVWLP